VVLSGSVQLLLNVTLVLIAVLVILVIVAEYLKLARRNHESILERSFENKGIRIVSVLNKNVSSDPHIARPGSRVSFVRKAFLRLGIGHEKKELSVDEEIRLIFDRISELVESDTVSKEQKERIYFVELENLKQRMGPRTGQPIKDDEKPPLVTEVRAYGDKVGAKAQNSVVGPAQSILPVDVKKVLVMADDLLGSLPDDVVEKFVASPEFETYRRVVEAAKADTSDKLNEFKKGVS